MYGYLEKKNPRVRCFAKSRYYVKIDAIINIKKAVTNDDSFHIKINQGIIPIRSLPVVSN